MMISQTSALQETIEVVERLSLEEQAHLLEIIYRRPCGQKRLAPLRSRFTCSSQQPQ